jgi:GAF domain-containing protein
MRLEELRLLSQMLALTSSDTSVQAVLERAAQNAARLTSSGRSSVAVPRGPERLRFEAEWDGSDSRPLLLGCELDASSKSVAAEVMADRVPVHVPGDSLLAQLNGLKPAQESRLQMRLVLLVPMVANERVEGILTVSRPRRKQRYSKHDLTLAAAIADHAALAIQGARAIERERLERQREQLLSRVIVLGLRPGTPGSVAREAIGPIRDAMGGSCVMALVAGAGGMVEQVVGVGDAADPGATALARSARGMAVSDVPLIGSAACLDGPIVVAAEPAHVAETLLASGPPDLQRAWRQSAIRSWAAVALRMGLKGRGVLAVGRRDADGFSHADLEFLRTTAGTLGLAMLGAADLAAG